MIKLQVKITEDNRAEHERIPIVELADSHASARVMNIIFD